MRHLRTVSKLRPRFARVRQGAFLTLLELLLPFAVDYLTADKDKGGN